MLRELPNVSGAPIMTRSGLEAIDCEHRTMSLYHPDVRQRVADDNDYSRRGSAHHTIKKIYVRALAKAQTGMDAELAAHAFEQGVAESQLIPRLIPEVRDIWDRTAQNFELDLNAYHSAEERIVRVDDVPIPFLLEADLFYAHAGRNEFEILDDKTYWRTFTEDHARSMLQTRYYVWAAMQEFPGFETYRFTYMLVRLNVAVSVVFSKDDFDMLNREIAALEARRRALYQKQLDNAKRAWEPTPGEHCAFCSLDCPLYRKGANSGLVRVNSVESFEQAANELIVIEKRKTFLQDSLKRYVTVEGPQNIRGEVFAFRPTVSLSYDVWQVIGWLQKKGLAIPLKMSGTALKALFKTLPTAKADLATMASEKVSSRFGHQGVKATLRGGAEGFEVDDE